MRSCNSSPSPTDTPHGSPIDPAAALLQRLGRDQSEAVRAWAARLLHDGEPSEAIARQMAQALRHHEEALTDPLMQTVAGPVGQIVAATIRRNGGGARE